MAYKGAFLMAGMTWYDLFNLHYIPCCSYSKCTFYILHIFVTHLIVAKWFRLPRKLPKDCNNYLKIVGGLKKMSLISSIVVECPPFAISFPSILRIYKCTFDCWVSLSALIICSFYDLFIICAWSCFVLMGSTNHENFSSRELEVLRGSLGQNK